MMAAAKKAATTQADALTLPVLRIKTAALTLIGDSPLIMHQWSEKARQQMRDRQGKKPRGAKEAKNPEQEYRDSMYRHPDGGYAMPATAFKCAATDACSFVDGLTKVAARGALHVEGEWVKILGEPRMREDMVRVGMGTADLRYRGEFSGWSAVVVVSFNESVLSVEQIAHLFDLAGFSIGVGEWRPQRDGSYGRFHVSQVDVR